jgi:hypothetical protein
MKLKDWADKQGISYLTAWRWFKAGDPRLANAYQSESGTIIVPDESASSELSMNSVQDSDVMAVILKKTVEFSKNEYAIEDFAAWILSNFTLKIKGISDSPKYSKVKPKPEQVQEHFKQFLKPKGDKPKPNMFVTSDPVAMQDLLSKSDDLTAQELVEEIHKIGAEAGAPVNPGDAPEVQDLMKDISSALSVASLDNLAPAGSIMYDGLTEGIVNRSVDLTPQQLNYTGSSSYAFSADLSTGGGVNLNASISSLVPSQPTTGFIKYGDTPPTIAAAAFQPTQKEIESAARISSAVPVEKPRRGRKSLKGKKQ